MDARLVLVGTIIAALAGGALATALVGGPVWLVVPGLLGAGLPALLARVRGRGQHRLQPGEPSTG